MTAAIVARSKGRHEIVIGLILIVVGILITAVTYDHASREGGSTSSPTGRSSSG